VVDLWSCNETDAQRFGFGAGSTLRVGPPGSVWCLGAQGGRTAPGTRVKLYGCDGSAGQRFRWGAQNRLLNPVSGLCVQPLKGSSLRGTPLVLARCTSADLQKWDASALVAARGEMTSALGAAHQICLTDPGALSAPGSRLEIDPCALTPAQIVTHRLNQLRIVNQCITAGTNRRVRSATVSLQPCAAAATQKFVPLRGGRLQNPRTALCLTVRAGRSAPHTAVLLASCDQGPRQQWRLPG
jgi:hypothetical protein